MNTPCTDSGIGVRRLLTESVVAGTIGAVAMMPFGLAFRMFGMRVGHYGPKFAALYLDAPGPLAMFVQHLVLGWLSALPLVLLSPQRGDQGRAVATGASYGVLYYVAVNALALPLYFQDPLPITLGVAVVVPSLVVHVAFGVAVAVGLRLWRRRAW